MRYLASIFFKSTVQKDDDSCADVKPKDGIWEETLFVVFAESEDSAISKANDIGRQESGVTYASENGTVVWEFVKVERVVPLDDGDLVDGREIFSRYLRPAEAQSILGKFDE